MKDEKTAVVKTIAAALFIAQRAIHRISKDAENAHHKYAYVSAESMIEHSREALAQGGLTLTRSFVLTFPIDSPPLIHSTFSLVLGDTGERIDFPPFAWIVIEGAGRPLDKALAGALTTSYGYFLRDLLLIPRKDEEEVDKRDDTKYQPPTRVAPTKPWRPPTGVNQPSAPERPTQAAVTQPPPPEARRVDPVEDTGDEYVPIHLKFVDEKTSKKGTRFISINTGTERYICFDKYLIDILLGLKGQTVPCIVERKEGMDIPTIVQCRTAPTAAPQEGAFGEDIPF